MKTPIDLPTRTFTSKISLEAHARLKELAARYSARQSDVISAALLYMDEQRLAEILVEQSRIIEALPRAVRGVLRSLDRMTDEQRAMIEEAIRAP